jgi:hypothetical protein
VIKGMHTLVVGGTGMLATVTTWLAEQGHTVSVVSRRAGTAPDGGVNPIEVDYRDSETLRQRMFKAMRTYGSIDLAVFWIHSDAPNAFRVIAQEISKHAERPWRLFHVRGSAAYLHPESPQVPTDCLYRQVILGFVTNSNGSRWLTQDEISGGVIEAIRTDREYSVVGTLHPWEKRPS